jgi:uncharacterized protein (DUF2062 family)
VQSRLASLIEATVGTAIGYVVAVGTQIAVFPFFGLSVGLTDNLAIAGIFTAVSIARGYMLRRLFERFTR